MTKPLLSTPLAVKDVTFKSRVVVAPMATYAAIDGMAQDFHFAHWGGKCRAWPMASFSRPPPSRSRAA